MRDVLIFILRVHACSSLVVGMLFSIIEALDKSSALAPAPMILCGVGLLCFAAAYLVEDGQRR